MSTKSKLRLQNLGNDEPEEWIWGNHRGGGGAPLKDNQGNSIANLKNVLSGTAQPDYLSPSQSKSKLRHPNREEEEEINPARGYQKPPRRLPPRHQVDEGEDRYEEDGYRRDRVPPIKNIRKNSRNYEEDDEEDYGGGRRERSHDNSYRRDSRLPPEDDGRSFRSGGGGSRVHQDAPSNYIPPQPSSPRKFMSGVQELNGITDRDRQEKARRALEYQNQLKRQIDEKNRKKEEEKQREEEIKRREWEEYMQAVNPNRKITNPHHRSPQGGAAVMKEKKKVPLFKPEDGEEDLPPVDYSRDNKRQQRHPRGPRGESDQDETDSVDEYNQQYGRGRGGAAGNSKPLGMKKKPMPRHEVDDDRYPPQNSPDKFVTVEEYDELSKLCDKLLSQQEALQSEIRNQSHLIKELQKKGAVAPLSSKPQNSLLRSKSVQQSRPNVNSNPTNNQRNNVGGGGSVASDNRSKSNIRPRPASMYEGSKQLQIKGNNRLNIDNNNNVKKTEQKKAMKSVFGHAIINDKLPAGNKPPAVNENKNNNNKNIKPTPSNFRDNNIGSEKPVKAVNGFAKLQAKVNHQPLIVSYEVEEPRGARRGGRNEVEESLNLELRGQSRYIPVGEQSFDDGDNDSYSHRNGGRADQLDKLLAKTQKGKYV